MSQCDPISRRPAQVVIWIAVMACLLTPAFAGAQTPWAVTLTPTLDPLPIGLCAAIHLTVLDASGKDAPRNPLDGRRVTIADFDITVTGSGVVASKIDDFHWVSCACQSATAASTATVTASYPSRSLAPNARVPGVTFQRAATFTIAPAKGAINPRACTGGGAVAASPAPPAGTLQQPIGRATPRVPASTPPNVAPAQAPPGTVLQPVPPAVPRTPAPAPAPASQAPPATVLQQPIGPAVPPTPPAAPPVGVALPPATPPVAVALPPAAAPPVAPVAPATTPPAKVPVPINPSGFTAVQIAPGQVRLSWQAVGGASFYGLFGPGLTAGGEKIVGGATTFTATNVPAGSQQWAVASFIDPGNISTPASEFPRVSLNVTPVPVNPSGFSAVQIGTGQVTLSWQPVNGASFYLLLGPGVTAGGEKVSGATTFTATNVPAGLREWAVASFYEPGNVSTVASAFPRVTLNVIAAAPPPTTPPAPPVTSARYRVVAVGFSVERGTLDNLLDQDGKGDEVYGGFSMFHVNRVNGQVLDQDLRRTKVHGQVITGTDRVKAGSVTPNGGLIGGDSYPKSSESGSAGDQTFPFQVWDGTLTNKQDAVVLLPTIWESDNDDSSLDDWFLSEKAALPIFWWDADVQAALTGLRLKVVNTNTFATGFGFAGVLPATSKDRPIGMTLRPTGFELQRSAIVLTREILEAALTPGSSTTAGSSTFSDIEKANEKLDEQRDVSRAGSFLNTPSISTQIPDLSKQFQEEYKPARPGNTIAVALVDGPAPNLLGNYTLYLRVERVP